MPKKNTKNFKRYMLVDGNALVHRAFHAIQYLATKSGEQTNAVYGFTVILLNAIKDIRPTHIAMTFDPPVATFRHHKYAEYKAHRAKAADELYAQFPRCKEVVRALGIPNFEKEGFEADDVLGTLACEIKKENAATENLEVMIVTGDMDTLQLVDKHVKIYTARKGLSDVTVYDEAAIQARYGISASQIIDFKAIKGDPSDNIPGITGIGEKGALDLIKAYGSIEGIYKNLDKLKEKQRRLFEEQRDQLELSRELSEIVCNVPIEYSVPAFDFTESHYQQTVQLFQNLEFKSLIAKLPKVAGAAPEKLATADEIAQAGSDTAAGAEKKNPKYHLVSTRLGLEELCNALETQTEFAFDTETDGLDVFESKLVGIGISYSHGEAYYIPAALLADAKTKEYQALRKIFANPNIKKIAHNIKFDYLVMKKFGMIAENLHFDTMIASYLLAPGSRTHSLDTAVFNEFGYTMQPIEDLIGKGKTQVTLADVPVERVSFYCCEDADFTLQLKHALAPRLDAEGFRNIFYNIEMPLTKVLAEMEENGILLDLNMFEKLQAQAQKELNVLEKRIYELAGEEFNINSPTQLKVILFEKLNISVKAEGKNIKKTKTGFSTAASELEKMRGQHEIIDYISQYRELNKLQTTYIETLPLLVSKKDGRLHTSYNQTIAATGRLSSSNPNLQNIPASSSGFPREIRRGFVAAPGYVFVSIDYSQIELRVVAHLAKDKRMMEIFKSGSDIHTGTAMEVYGIKDPAKVSKDMRRDAKTINFGVLYGLSAFGLSDRIPTMSRTQAQQFIDRYFEAFPNVKKYLDTVTEQTHKDGFVSNELGRKRYLPEINSSQFMIRNGAERAAINMPIQSLEADIVKMAMNQIAGEMDIQSEKVRMLLQIHDSLVFEIRDDAVTDATKKIKSIMEHAYTLDVPLTVDVNTGSSWGDLE